ncbi:MAG: hypothetical protein LBC83_01540 [Oscillospiraceae bacterium]|jgi:hypothetical protein|nr:hypothetical protein [Oscillospiraceae bacterium]
MKKPLPLRLLGRFLQTLPLFLAVFATDPFASGTANVYTYCIAAVLALGTMLCGASYYPLALAAMQCAAFFALAEQPLLLTLCFALCTVALTAAHRALNCAPRKRGLPRGLSAVLLGAAGIVTTFYQGAGYFEVPVYGENLPALLRSYRNLGFHPNWRAVLYSTIMMVVLIAWSRKFKRLSGILPAGFAGICINTALNLLLNPDPARTTVRELGAPFGLFLFDRLPTGALAMLVIFVTWDAFAQTLRKGGQTDPCARPAPA